MAAASAGMAPRGAPGSAARGGALTAAIPAVHVPEPRLPCSQGECKALPGRTVRSHTTRPTIYDTE